MTDLLYSLMLEGELFLRRNGVTLHCSLRRSDGTERIYVTESTVHRNALDTLLWNVHAQVKANNWQKFPSVGHEAEVADLKAQLTVATRERDIAIDRAGKLVREVVELQSENDRLTDDPSQQVAELREINAKLTTEEPAAEKWRERFENLRRRVKAAIDSVSR